MSRFQVCIALLLLVVLLPAPVRAERRKAVIGDYLRQTGVMVRPSPTTLGGAINSANHVTVFEVVRAEPETRRILYRKVEDLKGKYPHDNVCHALKADAGEEETNTILAWAEPGRVAIDFSSDEGTLTCLGNIWYGGERDSKAAEPTFKGITAQEDRIAYIGSTARLREHVKAILAGKEVTITAQAITDWNPFPRIENPSRRDWAHGKKGPVCRIKASAKITRFEDIDEDSPLFVGWGLGGADLVPELLKGLKDASAHTRAEATVDLGSLGAGAKEALPQLEQALKDSDPFVRLYAAEAIGQIDPGNEAAIPVLLDVLQSKNTLVRRAAAEAAGGLGSTAESAVPLLLALVSNDKDKTVRATAVYALGRVAPDATRAGCRPADVVPALARVLDKETDEVLQRLIIRSLIRFGPDAEPALGALGKALLGPKSIPREAGEALRRFGAKAAPFYMTALRDPKCEIREELFSYLHVLGSEAKKAAPALRKMLKEEDRFLRAGAASTLLAIDRDRSRNDALKVLSEIVVDEKLDDPTDRLVCRGFRAVGRDSQAAVPILHRAIRREIKALPAEWAVGRLGAIGPEARETVPMLKRIAESDAKEGYRVDAAVALWRVTGEAEDSVKAISGIWASAKEWLPRWWAINALGEMGPSARSALPLLRTAFRSREDYLAAKAALAFWQVARREKYGGVVVDPRQEAIDVLIALLKKDTESRMDAAAALCAIGREAKRAIPALVAALEDKDPDARSFILQALDAVGPDATACKAIEKALADPRRDVRIEAAMALTKTNRISKAVVAELARYYQRDPLPEVAEALGRCGAEAKEVVPLLVETGRHGDHAVHVAAVRALEKIDADAAARVRVR